MNPSELIGIFSHEIRNPLTLINSSLQLLETDCPAVLDCPLWPQIRQDMQDVLRLLNDMSALNKSSKITPAAVPVSGLLAGIGTSVRPIMEEKGIHFTISIDPSLSNVNLFADSLKIREAITNLLLNAVDAVSETDGEGEILLRAAQSRQTDAQINSYQPPAGVLIHIRDNGPGIPAEYMETLFEPFVTHKPHGTGLGLGIVKNIAALHGGRVSVDTCTAGQHSYTDFCLWLPLPE